MTIQSRLTSTIAGVVLSIAGIACSQSMPVTPELREKWNDKTMFDLQAKTIDGKEIKFDDWKGKTILVVNVASRCGFTRQYAGLQALQDQFKDQGLLIVGFPCNDFGGQEPGSLPEIQSFCSTTYGASFELFGKVHAMGSTTEPFTTLNRMEPAGDVGWNFEKFLVGKDGTVIERFKSGVEPEQLSEAIQAALAA